ncbi:MAG: hypothetical protein IID46_09695 [Planctomycetes bacterium]|nr:hypothetical protein [Planctomycetota bacterium]
MKLRHRQATRLIKQKRNGSILVLAAAMMVMILAFTAFTIDMGYIALTKTQLQAASDAGAHASGIELIQGFGPTPMSASSVAQLAKQAATDVSAAHQAGEVDSVYLAPNRDMRFGNLRWNDVSESWDELWGTTPYNLVEVTLRRDQPLSGNGDGRLPLFFAPVIGHETAKLKVSATIAMIPSVGFRLRPGSNETLNMLPITMDEETWENLIQFNSGPDNYFYDPETGQVRNASDGVREANLYPDDDNSLPAGNRGTVDFGADNNSTADIERQILYGLNENDLSYFPNNEIRLDVTPLDLSGDTGLSAGIKDELATIVGESRIIPIFRSVSNPGNNAVFTIVRFVGVRIMAVRLTGANRYVYIQPDSFVDIHAVRGGDGTISVIREDTVFAKPYLYR